RDTLGSIDARHQGLDQPAEFFLVSEIRLLCSVCAGSLYPLRGKSCFRFDGLPGVRCFPGAELEVYQSCPTEAWAAGICRCCAVAHPLCLDLRHFRCRRFPLSTSETSRASSTACRERRGGCFGNV